MAIHDLYMERLLEKGEWTLFSSYDVPELTELYGEDFKKRYIEYENEFKRNPSKFNKETKTIPAVEIIRAISHRYIEDGNPFIFFHDTANRENPYKELGIVRSSNLCFTGDTVVKTPAGDKTIEELYQVYGSKTNNVKDGEKFIVHGAILNTTTGKNGIVKKEWNNVTTPAIVFKTGKCKVVRVTLNNGGVFKCTPNHPIALSNGGYVEAINSVDKNVKSFDGEYSMYVTKVEQLEEEYDVYDLNVPATSNFYISVNRLGILVHNCVIGDTKVLTKEYGNIPIKQLVDNGIEETECWNGDEWSMTKIAKTNNRAHVVKVVLSNGNSLEATEYHKWKVYDNKRKRGNNTATKMVETKDLVIGDEIPYPNKLPNGTHFANNSDRLRVVSIIDENKYTSTYCGTEPKKHMLMFNGILTGQCTEIIMPTDIDKTAVCNLGSINLARCNTTEELIRVTKLALRSMDNCIDLTVYPSKESENWQKKLRSTGLGTLGLAEYLANEQIEYGSEKHKSELHRIYGTISDTIKKESMNLAKEKGECIVKGIRNAYRMAIAPNSSSAMFAGTTNSHELVYNLLWMETSKVGTYPVTAPHISLDNINYYKTSYQVDPLLQIEMTSIIQKYIDQGISHNIYIDPNQYENGVPLSKIRDIIVHAWKCGMKTLYYCRSKAKKNGEIKESKIVCSGCEN